MTTADELPAEVKKGTEQRGIASWYGEPYHGRRTASGEIYDMHELTAAHRTLAFGTVVRVTRLDNGRDVRVRINDRGPFIEGRIIDLSFAAAKKVGLDVDGVASVVLRVLEQGEPRPPARGGAAVTPGRDGDEADHCYWVQVGAFSDPDNARRARDRLRQTGEKAVVIEGPSGLDRVRVGPFGAHDDAVKARHRVAEEWPHATVVECGG